jgi:hypothetical protein
MHGDLPVVATEMRFEMELVEPDTGEVMPRKLVGYFDLVLADGGVVELKTARGSYSNVDLATKRAISAGECATRRVAEQRRSPGRTSDRIQRAVADDEHEDWNAQHMCCASSTASVEWFVPTRERAHPTDVATVFTVPTSSRRFVTTPHWS